MNPTQPAPAMPEPDEIEQPNDVAPDVPALDKKDGVDDEPGQYGENNETLPEVLQQELKKLIDRLTLENYTSRREEVKTTRYAREFWRGRQYLYWSENDGVWKSPNAAQSAGVSQTPNEDPPFQFVTNMYKGNGMQYAATITQSLPNIKWWPQRPKQKEDLDTARSADLVSKFIERNNRMNDALVDVAYFTWNDPRIGAYVRFVIDGEQFGYDEIPIMGQEPQQISPNQYSCSSCGTAQPSGPIGPDGMPPPPAAPSCPGTMPSNDPLAANQPCGADIGPWSYQPAQTAMVPVQTGTKKVPKGQEVIDFVGTLELRIPTSARKMRDYGYLTYETEQHSGKLRATYKEAASRIPLVSGGAGGDITEREARQRTKTGTYAEDSSSLITFKRTWLRPWTFYTCDDAVRDQLLTIFPNGAYVAFAEDTYCESRNESMDDHWRVTSIVPGETSVGNDVVSLQERFNTLMNIEMETYECGIPITFMDASSMSPEAWKNTPPRPGYFTPIMTRPGMPVGSQIQTTQAGMVSPQAVEHARDLMGPTAQFISGLFPALFGGGQIGNDTASGYAMQRDQAMGRIGLLYRRIKEFYAEVMYLGVQTFVKNRKTDVDIAVMGEGNQLDVQTIHLGDLQGSIYAYPEADEDYPMSWTQKKNAMMDILQVQNPALQSIWGTPAAASALGRLTGLGDEMTIPGADARNKQFREIAQLLQGQPVMPPPDPMTGAPALDPVTNIPAAPKPSVEVDPILDDHQTEFMTCQEWSQSDDGQLMKIQNPAGYENVRLHAQEHQQAMLPPPPPPGAPTQPAPPPGQ